MKAIVLNQETYKLEISDVEPPKVSDSNVLIKLKAASINHHELWSLKEKDLKSNSNIIIGSDGAGIVREVGSLVKTFKTGDEVIINPSINWGSNERAQGPNYQILGFPGQGTFAEYISIDHQYVEYKPKHLSFEESAALPLAGLTAYRALFTRGEFESNDKVLITGIGGGVALFALKFAVASGADVYVTSGSESKISKAIELGAKGGVNYKANNWSSDLEQMAGGFDVIVDSAAGEDFEKLTELANSGGRIALFGRTAGNITSLNPKTIFWKQLSIHGTTMGNGHEFKKMIEFVSSKSIHPVIDSVYPANNINPGFEKMNRGEQFGKIIINLDEF
ncbi:zinc-binding dehydrogenase [Christiangramia crocea]|uniref:Zinc-binding dehydrogenase n=1 Tax=Christiangramia crocea TaxID=2904124 RepID=A0A9X1UYS8_9FLAO|nr:zinc-binding dehydrogenase [Gramella crocea]MCG9972773.1 zinc-binding dehydrogenase [Gramella crocea]